MKRFIGWTFILLLLTVVGVSIFYKFYLPGLIADALVQEKEPAYIPTFVQTKIKKYKAPVNKGAEDVIREIHKSNVSLDQILVAIDKTEAEQVYSMLDELNDTEIKNTNQVFDLASRHFPVDFDIEVLRKPFNKNVTMAMIKKGITQANEKREEEGVDPEMAKSVIKQILRQKEQDFNKAMSGD